MTRIERLLGRTLRIGVTVSTILLAIGLVLALASPGPVAAMLLQAGLLVLMGTCLLYTSPSPRDGLLSRMPSSA